MAEILLAEDTTSVREGVKALLESDFHTVRAVKDGAEAFALYRRHHPALVILDVMMPRMDGFEVLRRIRSTDPNTPVLLLTARMLESDKLQGFGLGCDDYLTKPFSTRELVARVSALLRRTTVEPEASNINPDDLEFDFCGGTVVPLDRIFVNERNKVIRLSRSEIKLMRLFAQNVNRTLRKEMLLKTVWSGYTVQSRAIDTHITSIRRKVGRYGRNILNVYGVGYKFLGF